MHIPTTHGTIAIADSGSGDTALIFLHGNSSRKEVFAAQFRSSLAERYRLLAIDLPGHGESQDARDPQGTYTLPGYASVVREVLAALHIERYVVIGWSLGGHIGIELASAEPRPLGLVITGTPPLGKSLDSFADAFMPTPVMQLTGKPDFTSEEALAYARATTLPTASTEDPACQAAMRTDGRARARLIASFAEGLGADQRRTVEEVAVPLCIINGEQDPFLNHSYFSKLRYARLWRGTVSNIPGTGHAPFLEQPEQYDSLLLSFCDDVLKND